MSDKHLRGIFVEIEFKQDKTIDVDQLECESVERVYKLLSNLKEQGMIKGVYTKEHNYLIEDLREFDDWLYNLRIIRKKNKSIVKCIFEIYTKESIYQLYINQKEFCEENAMRISTKTTDMVHTKQLGFIVGPSIQLASAHEYVKHISQIANLDEEVIEICKKLTYEKGTSSKVLSIYVVQDEAESIDNVIFNAEFNKFQYVSYCLSNSS